MPIMLGLRIPDGMRNLPIDEVAAFAREVGLDVLDLPQLAPHAVQSCLDQGIEIGSVDSIASADLLSPDDAIRGRAAADMRDQIAAMKAAGVSVLFLCLTPLDPAQPIARSLELFQDTFPGIAAACEAADVRIAIEGWPGEPPFCNVLGYTPEVWRAMFQAVPSKALGLCFDPSHLVRLGIDYMRVLGEFKDRIVHCHAKDTELLSEEYYLYGHLPAALSAVPEFSDGPWRYCIPGSGCVNWARIAFQLEHIGYQGCLSIELEDARYCGSLAKERQGVKKALLHLTQFFT